MRTVLAALPFALAAVAVAQQAAPTAPAKPTPAAQEPVGKQVPPNPVVGKQVPNQTGPVNPAAVQKAPPPPVPKGTDTWFPRPDQVIDVPSGENEGKATFAFANPTGKEIEWKQLTGSCQCTQAALRVGDRRYQLKPKPYELVQLSGENDKVRTPVTVIPVHPGESGEVELHVDTHGIAGSKLVTLDLHTTDPAMPLARLQLTARGQLPFTLMPAQVELGNMTWGQKKDFSLRLTSPQKEFEILGHDTPPKELTLAYQKSIEGGQTVWTITGSYGGITSGEATGANVYLRTNIKGGDQILLKILASIKAPLTMTPGLLTLGILRRGKARIEKVTLTPTDGTDFEISKVRLEGLSVDPKFVTTRIAKDGKSAVLEVEFAADIPAGLVRGDVIMELTHPGLKEQKILLNGYAR